MLRAAPGGGVSLAYAFRMAIARQARKQCSWQERLRLKRARDRVLQLLACDGVVPWSAPLSELAPELDLGKNVYLNGTYKLCKTTLIAAYGQNRDATQYSNRDIDTLTLGAKYALTRSSELFAAWVDRAEDAYGTTAAKDYQTLTLGINAKFGY